MVTAFQVLLYVVSTITLGVISNLITDRIEKYLQRRKGKRAQTTQ